MFFFRVLGNSTEKVNFDFDTFSISRNITIRCFDPEALLLGPVKPYEKKENFAIFNTTDYQGVVPGQRPQWR